MFTLHSTQAIVLVAVTALAINSRFFQQVSAQDLDRFNYDQTVDRGNGYFDYAPPDWSAIGCNENNLDDCLAYPDKWHTGVSWEIRDNYCRHCPEGNSLCGRHHQSPIDVRRERGIPGHFNEKECIDVHWMKYEDSWCDLKALEEANAFVVDRHALRIVQPLSVSEDTGEYRSGCVKPGFGRRFGRIDFSKGFSQWWFLSHIDFKLPSEHVQQGHRYSVEAQMYHFYSVTAEEAGIDNEMGTVSVFMEVYDDAAPYRELDRVICQWRRNEEITRQECGLDPVTTNYPGCFPNIRTVPPSTTGKRNMRAGNSSPKSSPKKKQQFKTVHDLILHNLANKGNVNVTKPRLIMDDVNWAPPEEKDWESWIKEQSAKLQSQDAEYHQQEREKHDSGSTNDDEDEDEGGRNLIQGDEMDWFNYFLMLGVRTEYYYRYSGTQSIPPCYGNFQPDSRKETNHWRVMKDPIRIHQRQLDEMRRLMRDRIAPADDLVNACRPDTAAKVDDTAEIPVFAARPVQEPDQAHFMVFCECKDWPSKWPEDREWCEIADYYERFFTRPYNFQTDTGLPIS